MKKELFTYKNSVIKNVKDFCYLYIILYTYYFLEVESTHERKTSNKLDKKIRHFNLPVDCQLDLFDKVIQTVLLYSCEIIRS